MAVMSEIPCVEITKRLSNGESLKAIADSVGTTVYRIRTILASEGIKASDFRQTIAEQVQEHFDDWLSRGMSLKDAAQTIGVSSAHLSNTLRGLGLSLSGKLPEVSSTLRQDTDSVLSILMTEGGSVRSICQQLGVLGSLNQIEREIERRGVDASHYYYAFRRYGNWQVLPSEVRPSGSSDRTFVAKCLKCGSEHRVNYSNIVSGQSTACMNCRTPERRSVVDLGTGEIFSSVRAALVAVGGLEKYQSALYHFKSKGHYSINGHNLELTKQE